ncbi:hypothetical protein AB1K84_25270 [Mesobacillus foraminis]|uniref:hypothetical protein n=1 Tax=Mesobacillus foraminis TaxID=279826 RepID=UPI0039A3AC53
MAYLEQFSRKKKQQGESTVLTARLPSKLYDDLKKYTDELGLSISEAVNLLVEREIREWKIGNETNEHKTNTEEAIKTNTDDGDKFVVKQFNTVKKNTSKRQVNTSRFTTKPWQVNGELPCPYCKQWVSASNFSRHAKQHNTKTESVFTDQKYLAIVEEMIQARTAPTL